MAWALEFDPGTTGEVYQMHAWRGDLWGMCHGGAGAGVWRRTPPNWTHVYASGTGRGEIWDGQMWWACGPDPVPTSRYIYRSADGLVWVQDHDFGVAAYSFWSAMGGYGDYLYMSMLNFHGAANNTVYRRDTLGNYVATPPVCPDPSHGQDIIGFGGYVYWCDDTNCYRNPPLAWQFEPTLNNSCYWFTYDPSDGCLYAVYYDGVTWEIYRRSEVGAWALDQNLGLGGAYLVSNISIGSDGLLYLAAEDGADSEVYVRSGGSWSLHSTAVGARFHSVAEYNGSLYGGTRSCEFWAFTYDYDYAPVGSGLHPQSLACDFDGSMLYVAVYDAGGNPELIRVPLPLTATSVGTSVYAPGAGNAINVQAIDVAGDLTISGLFGNNEQVRRSINYGGAWTDLDPNTWGAVDRAQPLMVQATDTGVVLVGRDLAPDLQQRSVAGAWTSPNPAVPYIMGAMTGSAPVGGEVILGNAFAAARQIDRSIDGGTTLMDITGAFGGGGVAALDTAQEV
jgi:hypothetical protein